MSSSIATIAELLTLGTNASFDPSKLSTSTIQSVVSHIRTLKRNGIDINEQSLAINTEYVLDRLVDTKGKLLTDTYKRQIGMTIKRLYPHADISLSRYNKAHNESRSGKQTRTSSDEYMTSIRALRDATLNIIQDVYIHERIDDLGQYDACLAALITLCTSLRIEEVRQLKLSHIPKIRDNQAIGIKSKNSYATRVIALNDLLETIFITIQNQRQYVKNCVAMKRLDSTYQQNRIQADYIIVSSSDYMRKKLHEIAAMIREKFPSLGFTVFRKSTTTVLIEGGGYLAAQMMNNHSSLNTTLEHYNMLTSKSVQKTYDHLAADILEHTEIPSAKNAQNLLNKIDIRAPTSKPTVKPTSNPTVKPTATVSRQSSTMPPPATNIVPKAKNIETELDLIKQQLVDQSKNVADILQLKMELDNLKSAQLTKSNNAEHEIRQLRTKVDTLPKTFDEKLNNIKNEADKRLNIEFNAASEHVLREAAQINALKTELNNNLQELQGLGVGAKELIRVNNEFQTKISNIESSCINAQQLKSEYDEKFKNIESFVNNARSSITDPEKFDMLETNLKQALTTNVDAHTNVISDQISKISNDLNNLKQSFGIEHTEIKNLENQSLIAQTETNKKFQVLNDELKALRSIIAESTEPSFEPKRKRQRFPYETPPYTMDVEY